MPNQDIALDKFDGGFQPDGQPGALEENQWAQLDGFIFDREDKIRSQWAEQRVGSATPNWRWVVGYQGGTAEWLIAMDTAGEVFYSAAPADNAVFGTVNAVAWISIVNSGTTRRPLGLVLHDPDGTGSRNAMMVGKQGGSYVDFFYENSSGTAIIQSRISDVYPDDPDSVSDEFGLTGFENLDDLAVPTANVAAMWGDFLVLGDVTVKVDPSLPLTLENATRGRNAIWVSEPGVYSTFNPQTGIAYLASQEATIIALIEVDLGLLVFTTVADRNYDGVLLLRGSPTSYEVVALRAGVGPSVDLVDGNDPPLTGPHVALWPETGSAVFAGGEGGIWQTEGEQMDRLDHYGPDRYPAVLTTDAWYVLAFREQMIVSRNDGVHALRVFEETGAWTKLVTSSGGRPTWMTSLGGSLYWVDSSDQTMHRWAPENTAERGLADGATLTLTVGSRTVQESRHATTFWWRVGLVASSPGTATMESITTRPGAYDDDTGGTLATVLGSAIGRRGRFVVPAHGPSVECSVVATFTGDVVVEGITLLARQGRAVR